MTNATFSVQVKDSDAPVSYTSAPVQSSMSQFIVPGEHMIAAATTDPAIRAYAATNSDGYALAPINTDSTSTQTLPIIINNSQRSSYGATTLTYVKQQYDESQADVWAGPLTGDLGIVGTTFNISLPPWSITLVNLH